MTTKTPCFIIAVLFIFFLVQCKSNEQISKNEEPIFTPTLIVDTILSEHQYEGIDSNFLQNIQIKGKYSYIPQWAFAMTPSIEEVTLSPNIKIIGNNTFFSCKNLSKINLKDIESIGENCFKFTALKEINLKNTKNIGDFAFAKCMNLNKIEFSNKLDTIGNFAFWGDTALSVCSIHSGVIKTGAFMGCSNLKKIYLGKVKSIGKAAFLECTSLDSIIISPTIKVIENEAFIGCTNLKTVIVKSQDIKIAEDAFEKNILITFK